MSKSQRRKGNAQCASSSHAAEMLQNSGLLFPNLSFPNMELPSLSDSGNATSSGFFLDEFNSVSPELRITLKKLSKKDSLTREKGIREILDAIGTLDIAELKALFSCYASTYPWLATDGVPSIRCASNTVLSKFLKTLRKEADNSSLKQILPVFLFTLYDAHGTTARTSQQVLDECFNGDKRQRLYQTFSKSTINLALEIINRKHTLFFPQQTTNDETPTQRHNRLIAQAIVAMERLLSEDSQLSKFLFDSFAQQSTITALMKMSTNIKAAVFVLLKRLMQINPEPFFETHISSLILSNLDNADLVLCRNAFECFLILVVDERFRKLCKFEKAVVPKFLSIIRKKIDVEGPSLGLIRDHSNLISRLKKTPHSGGSRCVPDPAINYIKDLRRKKPRLRHWNVLASSLFPSFVVICKELEVQSGTGQWIRSALESFFEGNLPPHLIEPWSTAFVEIVEYCAKNFLDIPNMDTFLADKSLQFVNVIIGSSCDSTIIERSVDFVINICQINSVNLDSFKRNLSLNVLNLLPKSYPFVLVLLEKWNEKAFYADLINFSSAPDQLLVNALRKDLRFACAKIKKLDELLAKRIVNSAASDEQLRVELLAILCTMVIDENVSDANLKSLIQEQDPQICYCFSKLPASMFAQIFSDTNSDEILQCLINGILSGRVVVDRIEEERIISWILAVLPTNKEGDPICIQILNSTFLTENYCSFLWILLSKLFAAKKIPLQMEEAISVKIFESILLAKSLAKNDVRIELLDALNSNADELIAILYATINNTATNFERVKKLALTISALRFSDFSINSFLPTRQDFENLAVELEYRFLLDMLMEPDSFLFSFLSVRKNLFMSSHPSWMASIDVLKFLLPCAKKALFACQLIQNSRTNEKMIENIAGKGFIWLTAVFVEFFCTTTFSLENKKLFEECLEMFSAFEMLESDLLESVKLLLPDNDTNVDAEICCPISVIFALRKAFFALRIKRESQPIQALELYDSPSTLSTQFAQLSDFLKSDFVKYCPSLAFALSLNFNTIDSQIPILLEARGGEMPTGVDPLEDGPTKLRRWTYEFERTFAVFTPENRVEHFGRLSTFVESEFNEWLFTFQSGDEIKNALSCSVLRFCLKAIPYLAELTSAVRDFINCGFATALQSCTDLILGVNPMDGSRAKYSPLLFVLGQICGKIFIVYENQMRIHAKDVGYAELRQEWEEFFAPSAVNFLLTWFLNLAQGTDYPNSFTLEICRAIQFMDSGKIGAGESLVKFDLNESVELKEIAETFYTNYLSQKRNALAAVTSLLFDDKAEIQLTASKILKGNLLFMFEFESQSSGSPSDALEETTGFKDGFIVDDEDNEKENENRDKCLPKLLTSILQCNFLEETKSETTAGDVELLQRLYAARNDKIINPLLLVWDAIVRFVGTIDVLTRVIFCNVFTVKLVDPTLTLLFAKLPDPQRLVLPSFMRNVDDSNDICKLFASDVQYHSIQAFYEEKFVCNLYYRSLITVPAIVRQWYVSLPKNFALIVNRYTRKYVSPLVLKHEMSRVGSNARRGRLDIKIKEAVNEVAATYRMDSSSINLQIRLPEDFPLTLASIETQHKIVRQDLHRKWLLQLEIFFSHQNGLLLDGILQWKRNIDKHLEGVDDCTICMLTVSSTSYQLPRVRCRQCKNKFHGDCLYKWFKTSSNTSCPLCRTNFAHM